MLCSCVCTVAVSHRSTTAATPICTGSFGTPFRLLAALVVYFQSVVAQNQYSPTVRHLATPHQLRTTIGTTSSTSSQATIKKGMTFCSQVPRHVTKADVHHHGIPSCAEVPHVVEESCTRHTAVCSRADSDTRHWLQCAVNVL